MENDAGDAYPHDATAGVAGHEHEGPNYDMQMVRHIEEEEDADRGDLVGMGVFKPTSGNATKRLRVRQETRGTTKTTTTKAGKVAEAVIKQLASQELQGEKEKMEGWKAIVMQEVARELQGIRRVQEEAIEAQRQSFQAELERLEKTWDEKSRLLKDEIKLLKISKQYSAPKSLESALEKELAQSDHSNRHRLNSERPGEGPDCRPNSRSLAASNASTIPSSSKVISGIKSIKPAPKTYAQIAASNTTQSVSEKTWTEVRHSSKKGKNNAPTPGKTEPEKRRIIFRRDVTTPQKSEADLMLVLNEALQRVNLPAYIRFSKLGYSQSGAISGLLTEKSNAEELLRDHSTMLIRAAKSIDGGVIGIETLERWHRLKVHGMPLMRYLGEGKMELLCREIESSTGIKLKTLPRWLISEARLEERLETGNGKGSAIVITVGNEAEASKLCSKGLRFGGAPKVVEKYWEAGPGSVCMTCSGIGHDRLGGCKERPEQCVICAGAHKTENHRCGVTGCAAKKGKICIHVVPKCANCGGNHQATAYRCPARQKAQALAWKNKGKKAQEESTCMADERPEDKETSAESQRDREVTPKPVDMELDTPTDWAASPGQSSDFSSIEDDVPENNKDLWSC